MSYTNTFVMISDDSPIAIGQDPASGRDKKTKAEIEYEILRSAPYRYDHDDLNYEVYVRQKAQSDEDAMSRETFLSKGRPCLRASALVKRYGWGAHYDGEGRIALYAAGSHDYDAMTKDAEKIKVIKGMRSKRL